MTTPTLSAKNRTAGHRGLAIACAAIGGLAFVALVTAVIVAIIARQAAVSYDDWSGDQTESVALEQIGSDKPNTLDNLVAERRLHLNYPYWAENAARNYQAKVGQDGTYRQSGEDIAALFGIDIDYDFRNLYLHCDGTNLAEEETFAAYCASAMKKIYINTGVEDFDWMARSPYYPAAIRHEMAHYLIGKICAGSGSITPPIASGQEEAVTSSFAVLFLGADRTQLNSVESADYHMTASSDQIATTIHDEFRCE
jgi:hypothetical protein